LDVAQIYKSKLEAMGIPVLLQYESAGLVFGVTVDGLGQVRVLVPKAYSNDALELLDDELEGDEPLFTDEPGEDEITPPLAPGT
jgi:hypothetical protein